MTFRMWYEEVQNRSFKDLTPQEKNSMEHLFLDFLRHNAKTDVIEFPGFSIPAMIDTAGSPSVA